VVGTSGGSTRYTRSSAPLFDEVIGHERAKRQLEAAVRSGSPSHAYLLTGPDGAGKVTLARAFARALNCTAELDARPCGICRSCGLFASGGHPDFRQIDRTTGADDKRARAPKNIPIEAVRALQHDASLTSHMGGRKVYLIDGAEDLSLQAMDALLKTLEEPTSRVVIVMTCVDVGLLPLTVVSRCQVVKLSAVAPSEIAAGLVATQHLPEETAELLAHLSGGRPGVAIALAQDGESLTERGARLEEMRTLHSGGRAERLKDAERFAQEHGKAAGATARRLEMLLGWWRDLLLVRVGCEELVVNRDQLETLRGRASGLSVEQINGALRSIELTAQYLEENVQPRLALESLVLSLP
jgi:DNA polymerase-3 subunit delta'